MAVATKKKKGTTRKRISRADKPSKNGSAKVKSAGPGKFDTKQPPLPEMADVDERVPELDHECDVYLAADEKRKSSKVDRDESADRIKSLLKENDLDCYVLKGKKFFIEPGEPSVKVVKVKQNG